jgi:hypothetical protein
MRSPGRDRRGPAPRQAAHGPRADRAGTATGADGNGPHGAGTGPTRGGMGRRRGGRDRGPLERGAGTRQASADGAGRRRGTVGGNGNLDRTGAYTRPPAPPAPAPRSSRSPSGVFPDFEKPYRRFWLRGLAVALSLSPLPRRHRLRIGPQTTKGSEPCGPLPSLCESCQPRGVRPSSAATLPSRHRRCQPPPLPMSMARARRPVQRVGNP